MATLAAQAAPKAAALGVICAQRLPRVHASLSQGLALPLCGRLLRSRMASTSAAAAGGAPLDRAAAEAAAPPGWQVVDDGAGRLRLRRAFKAKNFLKALEAVNRVGAAADALSHHPDVHITDWNRVAVEVTSHDAGGLTARDLDLAAAVDAVDIADLLSKKQG